MTSFRDFLDTQMCNPDFRREYDALEPEFAIIQAIIDARKESGLTVDQISERSGISTADIERLENGDQTLPIYTLQKLASSIGKQVQIVFI